MNRTTDNNRGESLEDIFLNGNNECITKDFSLVADKKIDDLVKENKDLLVFPFVLNNQSKIIGSNHIFSIYQNRLITNNIMGFIGCNDTHLSIHSRFHKDENDYFLHYMLQKVFAINLFNLKHSLGKENIWDFLIYLFPYYLKRSLRQGLFKEYHRKEYNDANVKGPIDVNRHIKTNLLFQGRIAYTSREFDFDNRITQLIRHTIEFIRNHKSASMVLVNDSETREAVNQIIYATQSYNRKELPKIINYNLKPFNHPFFTEYCILQKICLQILKHEGLTYGKEKDKIYGILFDGAWLWEEYLNTFLSKKGFKHPENNKSRGGLMLFKTSKATIYPDFYKIESGIRKVVDAKYKHIENPGNEKDRFDYYQVITYMYRLKADLGFILYPLTETNNSENPKKLQIEETEGVVVELGLYIPENENDFIGFSEKMKINEDNMSRYL